MNNHNHKNRTERFLKDFEETSTTVILGIMVLSIGLYSIIWFYMTNRLLENHDKHSPESIRGLSVMIILPFIWFCITFFLKTIIFTQTPIIIKILEYIVWAFIFFLILRYLIDLTNSFTNITQSQPLLWNFLHIFGTIGLFGLLLNQIYLYPFLICILLSVLGMQSELNSLHRSHTIRKTGSSYYKR